MKTISVLPAAVAFVLGSLSLTSTAADVPASAATSRPAPSQDADTFAERRAIEALDRISDLFPFEQTKRGRVITLPTDDLFEAGSADLADSATKLESLAAALRQAGDHRIEINCYTDSIGDSAENEALSLKRAQAVQQYLVSRGVDGSRLVSRGMGAKHPVSDNSTPYGRSTNRRIEIVIEKNRLRAESLVSRRD
jgi:outer membrane protein OmpA-like peptidoglycan-associated protein